MNEIHLPSRCEVSEAVRSSLSERAALVGVPLVMACGPFQPVLAQGSDQTDLVSESTQRAADTQLEEIVVHGKVTLRHREAFSATKMNMDLKDIAQSVSVITEDLIEMADVQKLQDIYRVDASTGTSHRTDDFPTNFFRGFTIQGQNAIRIDGFRFPGNIELDVATFERFELVKGPTSALFGQNSLGGTINAVTKKPTADRGGELGVEFGSFNKYRLDVDLHGPLSADDRWQYRLVSAYRSSDTYIDFASDEAFIVAPSVAFEPSDRTRIIATLNYQEHDDSAHWGTGLQQFAPGQYRILPTTREHNFGQPWNNRESEALLGNVTLEQSYDNGWLLRANVQGSRVEKFSKQCSGDGNSNADGVLEFGCWTYFEEAQHDLWGAEVNLIGDVSILGREHTFFVGVDYSKLEITDRFGFDYIDDNGDGILDGGSAGYRLLPAPSAVHAEFDPEDLFYFYDSARDTQFAGVTLQALINPTERLQVLLSGRFTFDEALVRSFRSGFTIPEVDSQPFTRIPLAENRTEEFIPQIGVIYAVTDNVNIYANWGETYDPDPSTNRVFDPNVPEGHPLPPEEGKQVELGIKADILDNRASLTAAVFDMERSGISGPDRNNPGFSLPIGAQTVEGVEFALNGDVTESFNVYWSVAYLDAKYTAGEIGGNDVAPVGTRPVNTPKFASSLYANYAILDGKLSGLGLGFGWIYKERYAGWGRVFNGDSAGGIVFDVGDINEVDFRVHYDTDRWRYWLSVSDAFDDLYYSPVRAEYRWGISVNPGRRINAGVKYLF